jgi:hypothetical protein
MDEREAIRWWKNHPENSAKLNKCTRHRFNIPVGNAQTLVAQTWRCTKCHGEVTTEQKVWYERGVVHALADHG